MNATPDFVVFSPDHQPQLAVEVKGLPGGDDRWASTFRRNLLAHGAVPPTPYFLLVLPDHLYLWTHAGPGERMPDFRADTKAVLQNYISGWDQLSRGGWPSEGWLELAVSFWLDDLTASAEMPANGSATDWLHASGLSEKIRGGFVHSQSVA